MKSNSFNKDNFALMTRNDKGEIVPLVVRPVPCTQIVTEDINIRSNLSIIEDWISPCEPTKKGIALCSAGPSLSKYIDKVKDLKDKGYLISCVKHSLPILLKNGIVPDFCVVLDPRNVKGTSTHGEKRASLYERVPSDGCTFLVASMTDYHTTKLLKETLGYKVVGWHRYVDALKSYPYLQPQLMGGSCSALASVELFFTLGFREMVLVGFDSSYEKGKTIKQRDNMDLKEFSSKYEPHNTFLTTGELGALAQEFEMTLMHWKGQIKFDVISDGLVGNIWKHFQKDLHLPDYEWVCK